MADVDWGAEFEKLAQGGGTSTSRSDPLVYMGQRSRTTDDGDNLVAGKLGDKSYVPISEAALIPYESDATRIGLGEQMYENGLIEDPDDYDAINKMWMAAVDEAANFKAAGRDLTPWEVLDIMAGQAAEKRQPKTRTTTQTQTSLPNEADIDAAVFEMFRENLGRAPNQSEMTRYRNIALARAKQDPTTSTTTTQFGADGNATGSNTVTQQGIDAGGLAFEAQKDVMNTKEFGTQQAALTMYNWVAAAIGGG